MAMADDEPALTKHIRVSMNHPQFVFPGEDQFKRAETIICLLTMHKKLGQGGTFAVGEYIARESDASDDWPLALEMDQVNRSIKRYFRCDETSKRVLGFDHQLLQYSSFQTADASNENNVKSFVLGAFPDTVHDLEMHVITKINALGIKRDIAHDSVVGFVHIIFDPRRAASENRKDPMTKTKARRNFWGGRTLAQYALDMNGHRFTEDLTHSQQQDENWTLGDLREAEAVMYVVGNRIILMSWNDRSHSWLVTNDIKNVILMNLKCDDISEALAAIKSIQVSPLHPDYQITNPVLCRGLTGLLPTNTAFQENSARWKHLLLRLPGAIENATFDELKFIIDSILNGTWKDEPRQQLFHKWAQHVRTHLTNESFEVWRTVFAKVLFNNFKKFTARTVDTVAYSELHDSTNIQRALDLRHAKETDLHQRELQAMFDFFDSEFFRKEFKIDDALRNFIHGVLLDNLDANISEIFGHYFIVCPNAQDAMLRQVTQLDFSPSAGCNLT